MNKVVSLGGRWFQPAEALTSRQEGWVFVQLEDGGIVDLVANAGAKLLSEVELARKVIAQAHRSGAYHRAIAGMLVEPDVKWTVTEAEKNAEIFADLSTPEDKAVLVTAFVELVSRFFLSGIASSPPSPTASAPRPNPSRRPRRRGARSIGTPAAAGPTAPAGSPTATATA